MSLEFKFKFNGNIFFGSKSREKINALIIENGYKSICIVIDHSLKDLQIFISATITLFPIFF